MSMASERSDAKASIQEQEGDDPELSNALVQAGKFRVEIEKEGNRHKEEMAKGERGLIGSLLGGEKSATITVAFIAIIIGSLVWVACLIAAYKFEDRSDFWALQGNRALGLTLTALGYIFGRGGNRRVSLPPCG